MANVNGITKKIQFSWILDDSLNEKDVPALVNGLTRMAEKIKSLTGIDYDIYKEEKNLSKEGTTIKSYSFLEKELFGKTTENEIRIYVVNKRVYSRGNYELFGHQTTNLCQYNKQGSTYSEAHRRPKSAAVILNLDLIRRNSRNENDIEKLVYWFGIHEVGHVFGIAGKVGKVIKRSKVRTKTIIKGYRIKNGTAIDNRGEHCVDTTCNMFAGTGNHRRDADFAIKNSNKNIIHCKWCLAEWKAYPNILEKLGK